MSAMKPTNPPSPPFDSRAALRRLSAPHALAFGSRLLDRDRCAEGTIAFREFLDVARELVTKVPEQSAVYLAALVALDMGSDDNILAARGEEPSTN